MSSDSIPGLPRLWLPAAVSALVAAPFGYYLSEAESWLAPAGLALPFVLVAGAYAVKRCLLLLAWALWVPFVGAALCLAIVVLSQ